MLSFRFDFYRSDSTWCIPWSFHDDFLRTALVVSFRLKLKQNRYPVLFLTQGVTSRYAPFIDDRANSSEIAVNFAAANKILVRSSTYISDLRMTSASVNAEAEA